MADKISTADSGYSVGDLSLYPEIYDEKSDLHIATNNAETTLKQALTYNATKIILENGDDFPDKGILRVGTTAGEVGTNELIYYTTKTGQVITNFVRGYSGTRQNRWSAGMPVTCGVVSEHFNIIRDATYNIEKNLGIKTSPETNSLNYLLKQLETKWLAPRSLFRASTIIGPSPLTVRFQNFSLGNTIRYFWDFGDGVTSNERSPTHVYQNEGNYTVELDIITNLGATGISRKYDYITVDNDQVIPTFYALADVNTPGNLSVETAAKLSILQHTYIPPTTFDFVDQTDGNVQERYWVWDDGETTTVKDPNIHAITHVYTKPGTYLPSLLVVFSSTVLKRAFLQEQLTVN